MAATSASKTAETADSKQLKLAATISSTVAGEVVKIVAPLEASVNAILAKMSQLEEVVRAGGAKKPGKPGVAKTGPKAKTGDGVATNSMLFAKHKFVHDEAWRTAFLERPGVQDAVDAGEYKMKTGDDLLRAQANAGWKALTPEDKKQIKSEFDSYKEEATAAGAEAPLEEDADAPAAAAADADAEAPADEAAAEAEAEPEPAPVAAPKPAAAKPAAAKPAAKPAPKTAAAKK